MFEQGDSNIKKSRSKSYYTNKKEAFIYLYLHSKSLPLV
jgi:hypothetical protein